MDIVATTCTCAFIYDVYCKTSSFYVHILYYLQYIGYTQWLIFNIIIINHNVEYVCIHCFFVHLFINGACPGTKLFMYM